jgi:hypothetical protein
VLKDALQPQYPYSSFSACVFLYFDLFICQPIADKFGQEFSDVLTEAYQRFAS